jgi:hypothetical protein
VSKARFSLTEKGGGTFDMGPLPALLHRHPNIPFLVDEAFIGLAGQSVAHLVPAYRNLLVTRTLSKAQAFTWATRYCRSRLPMT